MSTSSTSLFALDQKVEVLAGPRWLPAVVTAIRLTAPGIFYEVAGDGFAASVPPADLRSAGDNMPGRIVVIYWKADGISYEIEGPRRAPQQVSLRLLAARANDNAGSGAPR